jgi:hypothetical protein
LTPKNRQAQLPEEIGMFVDTVRAACPSIEQVWLLDAGASATTRARWDFLAFADDEAVRELRAHAEWHRPDVSFLVATPGENVEAPWGETLFARLNDVDWRLEDAETASYSSTVDQRGERVPLAAHRVR